MYFLEDAERGIEPHVPIAVLAFSQKKDHFLHLEPFSVQLSDGTVLEIPKDLVTDLASIPNFLKGIIPFTVFGGLPFFIHDMAYVFKLRIEELGLDKARKFWDDEMLSWCLAFARTKKEEYIAYLLYYSVRLLGRRNFMKSQPQFYD